MKPEATDEGLRVGWFGGENQVALVVMITVRLAVNLT
jgi:hypothetical protein